MIVSFLYIKYFDHIQALCNIILIILVTSSLFLSPPIPCPYLLRSYIVSHSFSLFMYLLSAIKKMAITSTIHHLPALVDFPHYVRWRSLDLRVDDLEYISQQSVILCTLTCYESLTPTTKRKFFSEQNLGLL